MTITYEQAAAVGTPRRWSMLGASTVAQASAAVMAHGPAFLIPALVQQEGLSLVRAGVIAAAPTFGVMLTLVAWGVVTDRRGERLVLLVGLCLTAVAGLAAALSPNLVWLTLALFLGGASAASTNAASGRVVVGWFPPRRRGLAMGIRQMAQPVGVGIAAITSAVVADAHGVYAALWIPTVATALAAALVALVIIDPPRPDPKDGPAANPYRGNRFLARIHGVSVLLVVPQFVVWTFALVWLVQDRGWSPGAAGTLVAVAQVGGALGRIAAGQLSDIVGSRMRPLRWVAIGAGLTMAALGAAAGLDWAVAVPLIVLATVLTVADNGLAFTAVAERAGPHWSGRALGVQNTARFLTSALVPPLGGLAVTHGGYPATFALAAAFPLVAIALVPVEAERELT
ncbi:MFS transporter [soil metagenome]